MSKIPAGIIHGRFQPPHNGHLRYILSALEKCEHLMIGICTPEICSREFSEKTGYPCTAEQNPFSYEERVEMIRVALAEAGAIPESFSFIPFPSNYRNMPELPKDIVFFMSIADESEKNKIKHLENLGYKTEVIIESPLLPRDSSGKVRDHLSLGNEAWQDSVPPAVSKYIKEHDLEKKLMMLR